MNKTNEVSITISKYTGPHTSYAEVGQTNKLRWINLFREGSKDYDVSSKELKFSEQSKQWKCKDFLNECVAARHGHILGCYGFTADSVKTNDEGIWVKLLNIADKECYKANIGTINELAVAQGFPTLELLEIEEGFVCLIPAAYLETTYPVSLLTYLMRVSNVPSVITDKTFMEHPTKAVDNPFPSVYAQVLKQGFKTPENVGNSYYYYGCKHDYSKKPAVMMVHNCGVSQWTCTLNAEKAANGKDVPVAVGY